MSMDISGGLETPNNNNAKPVIKQEPMIKKEPMIKEESMMEEEPMIKEEMPKALNIYSIKKEDEEEDEEDDEEGEEGLVVKSIGRAGINEETRELEYQVEWKGRNPTIETKATL
jgi:hypothetical protein